MKQETYTVKQFCYVYNISRSLVNKLWAEGRGPSRAKVNGKVLIKCDDAIEWLEKNKSTSFGRQKKKKKECSEGHLQVN